MSAASTVWPGRSHVSTFVHSLHLLDLDQLEDWPEVTARTFDPRASLQHRIRAVEWSLYRLFERYDARPTRDKLRPFFPPTTSLQSVNLRAALLRQLTELKRDGVLGQNVVLRKTMLDECKGDKFEELLAHFSIVVLKKQLARSTDWTEPVPPRGANVVPLILSYRKGIQRDLEKRKEIGLQARRQQQTFDTFIVALRAEAAVLKQRNTPDVPENAELLRRVVRENWIGDPAWVDTILYGIPPNHPDEGELQSESEHEETTLTLLDNLNSRVRTQNARLAQWQACLDTLERHQETKLTTQHTQAKGDGRRTTRFTRHQSLMASLDPADVASVTGLKPQHEVLLQSLNREMSLQNSRKRASQFRAHHRQRPSIQEHLLFAKQASDRPDDNLLLPNHDASRTLCALNHATVVGKSQPTIMTEQSNMRQLTSATNENSNQMPTKSTFASTESQALRTPPKATADKLSLLDRTRQSLAHLEAPKTQSGRRRESSKPAESGLGSTVIMPSLKGQSDRTSLLDRTRQSMSMLTNAFDDHPRTNAKSRRPQHSRSKTVDIPSSRPRLERAWSEESLASVATKEENLDVEADYDSVFKSRPRLAMSPNLSPQRSSHDLWLDNQLEESMNKLTINSSPEY